MICSLNQQQAPLKHYTLTSVHAAPLQSSYQAGTGPTPMQKRPSRPALRLCGAHKTATAQGPTALGTTLRMARQPARLAHGQGHL